MEGGKLYFQACEIDAGLAGETGQKTQLDEIILLYRKATLIQSRLQLLFFNPPEKTQLGAFITADSPPKLQNTERKKPGKTQP